MTWHHLECCRVEGLSTAELAPLVYFEQGVEADPEKRKAVLDTVRTPELQSIAAYRLVLTATVRCDTAPRAAHCDDSAGVLAGDRSDGRRVHGRAA